MISLAAMMRARPAGMAALLAAGLLTAGCQDDEAVADDGSAASEGSASATDGSTAEDTEAETSDTGAASEQATDAALDAARSNTSPTGSATEAARDAAGEEGMTGAEAAGGETLDDLLTPEAWDSARVIAAIRASDLPQARKDEFLDRVRSLDEGEDPALRDRVIAELREVLVSR